MTDRSQEREPDDPIIRVPLIGLLRRARSDLNRDVPGIVRGTPRSGRLQDLAMEMAEQGREDQTAVNELVRASQGHNRDLRAAAAQIRMSNFHHEDHVFSLANRLLVAAADRSAVQKLTGAEIAHMEMVEQFAALPPESAYEQLRARCPRLSDAEDAVQRGEVHSYIELMQTLEPIVGPRSDDSDPLVSSHRAHIVAEDQLARAAGLVDWLPEDEDVPEDFDPLRVLAPLYGVGLSPKKSRASAMGEISDRVAKSARLVSAEQKQCVRQLVALMIQEGSMLYRLQAGQEISERSLANLEKIAAISFKRDAEAGSFVDRVIQELRSSLQPGPSNS